MVINILNISKSFFIEAGFNKRVLNEINFSLNFNENKFISLVAPFGSGKSTLLKILAGLIQPDSGKIIVNEEGSEKKINNVIYIPSTSVSIPWLNVKKNIEFGIPNEKISDERTNFIISLIGLEGYEEHIPDKNSIGFRFRISLGRALYNNPKLILMDEPFDNLDSLTKEEIYSMLKIIVNQVSAKFILATSNLLDAIYLSNEVILFSDMEKSLIESFKIEKSFTSINEMLRSDYLTQFINKIHSTIEPGFRIKDFSI